MKKILITGGAGFIGSHTCLTLLGNGYEVIVLDSFANSSKLSISRVKDLLRIKFPQKKALIKCIQGDIRQYDLLNNIFEIEQKSGCPIDAVIHFAGLKSVNESISNPIKYWDVNVHGSISLFRAMQKNKCNTLVFSSSATIYGDPDKVPIVESSEIKPVNPYGRTKANIEKILNDLYLSSPSNWKIACLRYFNPIGAHPSGLMGEDPHDTPNNLFPYLTKVAAGKLEKLTIYGNDWPTKDGTGIRDYIHVMDLAEGHKVSLEYLECQKPQILNLNIGNGKGFSVLEIVNTFQEVNNCKIPYVFSSRRPGDIAVSYADCRLSNKILNWRPSRTILDMCRDGWSWQVKNPNGYES